MRKLSLIGLAAATALAGGLLVADAASAHGRHGYGQGGMMGGQMMGPGMADEDDDRPYGMMRGQAADCPYRDQGMMGPGMMGGGMMQGPMMGQGMMGGGMMQGPMMGYGMMDRQGMGGGAYGWPLRVPRALTEEEVTQRVTHMIARSGNPNIKLGEVVKQDEEHFRATVVTNEGSLVQTLEIDRIDGFIRQVDQ